MLELTLEELNKLISTLKWVQIATLSTDEERHTIQNLIEKLRIAKKTSHNDKIKFTVK